MKIVIFSGVEIILSNPGNDIPTSAFEMSYYDIDAILTDAQVRRSKFELLKDSQDSRKLWY
jgi:hypothetical protein